MNSREVNGYVYWEYVEYILEQIVLTSDFQFVLCLEDDGRPAYLEGFPLDALAVATATTHFMRAPAPRDFKASEEDYRASESVKDVVGLELVDGYFQIVNEAANFAGICKKGDDATKVDGCLSVEYLDKLKKAKQNQS